MKKELSFKEMSDFELMAHESQLKMSIETILYEMRYNERIVKFQEELAEVEKELERRKINIK